MSVFRTLATTCPSCHQAFNFETVYSVNADRRPDLRDAILDGSLQQTRCPACDTAFRVDPEFTYLNLDRRLWIAAFGAYGAADWPKAEQEAQTMFEGAFGSGAPATAQALGAGLDRRITFGWPALREKLLLREHELDDLTIELVKSAVLRSGGAVPLDGELELRVVEVDDLKLVCAWMHTTTGQPTEVIEVPREVYDGIVADPQPWDELRAELGQGLYVDLNRMLVAGD